MRGKSISNESRRRMALYQVPVCQNVTCNAHVVIVKKEIRHSILTASCNNSLS